MKSFTTNIDSLPMWVQYLIKKADYIHEDEVRIFFSRNGDEADIKMTNIEEYGMPRLYLNSKVQTDIKEIILGPKIGNGYDKVPFIYQNLQEMKFKGDIKVQNKHSGLLCTFVL